MKTIAIMNMKGGVGKTTTAVNVADVLSREYGKSILLIDCDKQGNLSKNFNLYGYDYAGLSDLLTGADINACMHERYKNDIIKVIPANMNLLTANLQIIKDPTINQTTILKDALAGVAHKFDYCFIDCAPDINISIINALVAADEVIIPVKIDGYTFDGMQELETQIENAKRLNPRLKFRGCLVTMFYNREVCKQGEAWLRSQRYPVFKTHIRRSEKADEATFANIGVMAYSPRSGAARDYRAFAKEYLEG